MGLRNLWLISISWVPRAGRRWLPGDLRGKGRALPPTHACIHHKVRQWETNESQVAWDGTRHMRSVGWLWPKASLGCRVRPCFKSKSGCPCFMFGTRFFYRAHWSYTCKPPPSLASWELGLQLFGGHHVICSSLKWNWNKRTYSGCNACTSSAQ